MLVAVCCSVLQYVEVCSSVLQCVAVCFSVFKCVSVYCSVLQCVAVCCSVLQCIAVCRSVLPWALFQPFKALWCSALWYVSCSVLSYDVVCCSVLQGGIFQLSTAHCIDLCMRERTSVCMREYDMYIYICLYIFTYTVQGC